MVTIVIGAQWGDEGKGKIMDVVSTTSDVVVRFHGGNNAGHTVINKYGKFPLHMLPSGVFNKKAKAFITNGTVLNLEILLDEIEMLKKAGFDLTDQLYVSPRCHIIFPYHQLFDGLFEKALGKKKIGTTGRGIGPVHADKVSYQGIRLIDLLDKKQFSEKLETQLKIKNIILKAFGEKPLDQKDIEKTFFEYRRKLLPYIREPYPLMQKAIVAKKKILLEGAQGVFLDNDWGTYPYITASSMLPGNANANAGIPPQAITDVIGVVKAYTTRVGDAELIRFAAQICGFTKIAITKLDILDKFSEIKICMGYELDGKKVSYYDGDAIFLGKVKPVYKTIKGWNKPTTGVKKYEDLPVNAKKYLAELEKQIGVPVKIISVGPDRKDTIQK